MISLDQKKFEETVVRLKLLSQESLDAAKIESVRSNTPLEDVLVSTKKISPEEIIKSIAISMNFPYVDLTRTKINPDILKFITKDIAKKYKVIPFGETSGALNLAMVNPNNIQAIEYIEKSTAKRVIPYMASEGSINSVLDQYSDLSSEVKEALKSIDLPLPITQEGKKEEKQQIGEIVQDAPVTRAVNTILEYASKSRASDIHIEPWENSVKIRYRIDGILEETMSLPIHIQAALVSRIKILSDLKIDEHRIPQDGRFDVKVDNKEIDIRVAVSPTVHGEKVVMRLLDKSGGVIDLDRLGIKGRALRLIEEGIKSPHGMVLSTGPTGSGKTTSLYAILTKLNTPAVNIITLEDPVEYQVPGVNQIQVNASIGLTFASGLRSILRQDPDIVMVGEIRDAETADLAVQSALTGHMVLSTLHTNSASGVLPRLLDMKIEPFLIASTVATVIGQRLVRQLCQHCKEPQKATVSANQIIQKSLNGILPKNQTEANNLGYENIPKAGTSEFVIYKPVGCARCNNTGYLGRIGIFEVFNMSSNLEKLIVSRATTSQIQQQVIAEGMSTMRQDGFLKVLEGITTIEEVIAKAAEV